MNKLQTQPAPAGVSRANGALRVVVIAVVVIATVLVAMRLVERPPFVDRVSIVNRSSLELDVDTSGSPNSGWTPAGAVLPGETASFLEVVDHGDTWWIRVTAGGHVARWQVPRAQLEQDHYRIPVPTAVIDTLASPS